MKATKWPCLSASIAIACRMGKGPYFACQIQYNELHLLQHGQLPPPKTFTWHGPHMLLDNETFLHNMCTYLTSQVLGSVTPWTFSQQVNSVILPALGINATISESTAQQWLKHKLGYESKEAKTGIYVDGHEHLDVIKERGKFIKQLFNKYEWYVKHVHCPELHRSDHCTLIQFNGLI